MFGTYEDNVMICRRKIAQASETPIMIEKRNSRSRNDESGEKYKIQKSKIEKQRNSQ